MQFSNYSRLSLKNGRVHYSPQNLRTMEWIRLEPTTVGYMVQLLYSSRVVPEHMA